MALHWVSHLLILGDFKLTLRSKKSMQKLYRSWCLALVIFIISTLAHARIPLSQFFESAAGRFIFSQTTEGNQMVRILIGRDVLPGERAALIREVLQNRRSAPATRSLKQRLNIVYDRFALEHPEAARSKFRTGSTDLTTEEANALRTLMASEFDHDFLESIARAIPASAGSALRQNSLAFLRGETANKYLAILQKWVADGLNNEATSALQYYEQLRGAHAEIEKLLKPADVYRLLADEEMLTYIKNLDSVLKSVSESTREISVSSKLYQALRKNLNGKVPAHTIATRLEDLQRGGLQSLRRALGDMTLQEVQLLVHGGNPLKPTAKSLLGRYLKETGATTVVRTFSIGPNATDPQGPQRLVVAVSNKSLPKYMEYFTSENFLTHVHAPDQGTLQVGFQGKVGTYANLYEDMRSPRLGTMMINILLKSTEGQRVAQFFKLGQDQQYNLIAQWPWQLPNYCATSGYSSCTHWVGNIPIGDKLVAEYKFPGRVDQHAYNATPDSPLPRIQKLNQYEHPSPLVKRVWKVPGNEQLANTLGLGPQNLAGEFANPGWVAITLTGPASTERVPVVFLMTADHKAAIAADFPLNIHAY
jgi:hypothetical protein